MFLVKEMKLYVVRLSCSCAMTRASLMLSPPRLPPAGRLAAHHAAGGEAPQGARSQESCLFLLVFLFIMAVREDTVENQRTLWVQVEEAISPCES